MATKTTKGKRRPKYRLVGPYRLTEELGEGGMGIVFKGFDEQERPVAVKVLHPHLTKNADISLRFVREAEALERMTQESQGRAGHQNVVRFVAHGSFIHHRDGELLYLVMEWLDGVSLEDRLREGPMSVDEALETAKQLCRGVIHAHNAGIIHRDLKPANVILCNGRTNGDKVKVVDFGIARALEDTGDRATRTGYVFGTPRHAAPEQLMDTKSADERADVFAIGSILFRLFAGYDPFPYDEFGAAISARTAGVPNRPNRINPKLWTIVAHCLEMDRERRYQEVSEVLVALETYTPPAEEIVAPTGVAVPSAAPAPQVQAVPPTRAASEAASAPLTEVLQGEPARAPTEVYSRTVFAAPPSEALALTGAQPRRSRIPLALGAGVSLALLVMAAVFTLHSSPARSDSVTVSTTVTLTQTDAGQDAAGDASAEDAGREPSPHPRRRSSHRRRDPLAGMRRDDGTYQLPTAAEWQRIPPERRGEICEALRAAWVRGEVIDRYCPREPAPTPAAPTTSPWGW